MKSMLFSVLQAFLVLLFQAKTAEKDDFYSWQNARFDANSLMTLQQPNVSKGKKL
jgi:hypothetical protein